MAKSKKVEGYINEKPPVMVPRYLRERIAAAEEAAEEERKSHTGSKAASTDEKKGA